MAVIKIQGDTEKKQRVHYVVDTATQPLGVGGMGQVFRGKRVEETTGVTIDVAVKFLFDDLGEAAVERSRREASIQIDNENLVKMYGFIQIDEQTSNGVHPRYHVVSELLHGVMLLDLLNGKFTDSDGQEVVYAHELYNMYKADRYKFAIFIIKNMLSGIMALHDKGYIHRDIDPSNIMVTADGKVKIIDFGISKQLKSLSSDRHLTSTGQFMGKAAYAAPELVLGDVAHQNETTDIYAIGIVFYELVTGRLPFDGSTNEVLNMQLKNKLPLDAIESKQVRRVIAKATEKKQADRYQSASEFRVSVEQLERTRTRSDVTVDIKPNNALVEKLKEKRTLVAAVAAVVILVGGGAVALSSGGTEEETVPAENVMTPEKLSQLKAEKEREIIDDNRSISETDSLTGVVVKSAGMLTDEALALLSDSTASPESAIRLLDRVIANARPSSARAAYTKGIMHLKNGNVPANLAGVKQTAQASFAVSDSLAHIYYAQAVELDPTFYPALFELGTDYNNGKIRGIETANKPLARTYFEKALKYATDAGDSVYVVRIQKALSFFEK